MESRRIINIWGNINVIITLIFILKISINAQTIDSTKIYLWLNGALGFSTVGSLAGSANINLQMNRILFSLRTSGYLEELGMFSGGDEFSDITFLIGIGSEDPDTYKSISIGITKFEGSRYIGKPGLFGGGKRISINSTYGIALESQFNYKINNFFGIGVIPYVNINREESLFCLTFCLILGKLN